MLEAVGEVHALDAEGLESEQEAHLGRVGHGVEVADEHGGEIDADRRLVLGLYAERGIGCDPLALRQAQLFRPGAALALRREEMLDDRTWSRSMFAQEVCRPVKVAHLIYSTRSRGGPGLVSGLGFTRRQGDPPVDEDERNLVQVFHDHVLAGLGQPRALPWKLSQREQDTLRCLLDGMSQKEAAAHLGLSAHTVHQYVKSLYRRVGVASRFELFAAIAAAELAATRH